MSLSKPLPNNPVCITWKDDKYPNCGLCKKRFTLLVWKHHCRPCGDLVCNNCSKSREVLGTKSQKPQRVCDGCSLDKQSEILLVLNRTMTSLKKHKLRNAEAVKELALKIASLKAEIKSNNRIKLYYDTLKPRSLASTIENMDQVPSTVGFNDPESAKEVSALLDSAKAEVQEEVEAEKDLENIRRRIDLLKAP